MDIVTLCVCLSSSLLYLVLSEYLGIVHEYHHGRRIGCIDSSSVAFLQITKKTILKLRSTHQGSHVTIRPPENEKETVAARNLLRHPRNFPYINSIMQGHWSGCVKPHWAKLVSLTKINIYQTSACCCTTSGPITN